MDALNEDIRDAIACFRDVGVKLSIQDFCYSRFVKDYIRVILNGQDNDEAIKKKLDEVYWKCPKVMNQIACNFHYLYYRYEKYFIRYYEKLKNGVLVHNTYDDIHQKYWKI